MKDYRNESGTDTATASGDITFIDPCIEPFTSSSATQSTPAPSDNFSGTKKTKTIDDFNVTPSRCSYTYSCDSVVGVGAASGLTCSDLDFSSVNGEVSYTITSTDYTDLSISPGTYTVTVLGTVDRSNPSVTHTETFTITLTDPCDPPVSITAPTLVDQSYTLYQPAETYTHE